VLGASKKKAKHSAAESLLGLVEGVNIEPADNEAQYVIICVVTIIPLLFNVCSNVHCCEAYMLTTVDHRCEISVAVVVLLVFVISSGVLRPLLFITDC